MGEVIVYQPNVLTDVKPNRGNYIVSYKGSNTTLVRNDDFAKFGKAKKPSLLKSGAEKVLFVHGLLDRYVLEEAHEDYENGVFFYRYRCDCVLVQDGREVVFKSGWGSANTRESSTGTQSPWDGANSALKKAKKRAMVDAAVSIGRLSGMFTQDIENDEFMEGSKALMPVSDDEMDKRITAKQVQRLFAIAGQNGVTNEQAKEAIKAYGYGSTKDILQKDYDALCEVMANGGKA